MRLTRWPDQHGTKVFFPKPEEGTYVILNDVFVFICLTKMCRKPQQTLGVLRKPLYIKKI